MFHNFPTKTYKHLLIFICMLCEVEMQFHLIPLANLQHHSLPFPSLVYIAISAICKFPYVWIIGGLFFFSLLLVNFSVPRPIPCINYYRSLISLNMKGKCPNPIFLAILGSLLLHMNFRIGFSSCLKNLLEFFSLIEFSLYWQLSWFLSLLFCGYGFVFYLIQLIYLLIKFTFLISLVHLLLTL